MMTSIIKEKIKYDIVYFLKSVKSPLLKISIHISNDIHSSFVKAHGVPLVTLACIF